METFARVEVLVVGSGSAGSTAAIAAARAGASTLLVEKQAFLGGTSTAVLDTFYGFYTPGETPRKVVGGIGGVQVGLGRPQRGVLGSRGGPVLEIGVLGHGAGYPAREHDSRRKSITFRSVAAT